MSCSNSEESSCCGGRFFMFVLLLAVGAVVLASLPEIKRYIRISTM